MLWAKWSRSRAKRSSGDEGKVVQAAACSGGKAVEGALRRWRRALGICSVKDLKHASGEILLSVERATHAPDIYIGGQMRDTRSLRHIVHFFKRVAHYF
jgi:hypothetical protein